MFICKHRLKKVAKKHFCFFLSSSQFYYNTLAFKKCEQPKALFSIFAPKNIVPYYAEGIASISYPMCYRECSASNLQVRFQLTWPIIFSFFELHFKLITFQLMNVVGLETITTIICLFENKWNFFPMLDQPTNYIKKVKGKWNQSDIRFTHNLQKQLWGNNLITLHIKCIFSSYLCGTKSYAVFVAGTSSTI